MSDREWQPIETAPMSGVRMILFADGKVCTGGYDAHWSGQTWVYDQHRIQTGTVPTHWMPLPPAPRQKEDAHV